MDTNNEIKGNKNKSFKFIYRTSKDKENIYILGETFVENNRGKCSLIMDDYINCELRYNYRFDKKGEHSVTLVINEDNINFSNLFFLYEYGLIGRKNNNNLIDASSLKNLDTSECTDLSYMFCGCIFIKDFSFVKNWDVSKCKNFEEIFCGCSFSNLNFLSKWDLSSALNLRAMFDCCIYLKNINGITNWNVQNAENFQDMFSFCSSLTDVNALQNWNMSKAKDLYQMFNECKNLITADSLYKWKLGQNIDKRNIINGCDKLLNVPSIFRGTTQDSCEIY